MRRTYTLDLPITSLGDDLELCVERNTGNTQAALVEYTDLLEESAARVMDLQMYISQHAPDTVVHGRDHLVFVTGHDQALDQLMTRRALLSPIEAELCGPCGCDSSCAE